MKKFLTEHPWIWFVLGFVVMIALSAVFVVIAVKNEPASVPLQQQQHDGP